MKKVALAAALVALCVAGQAQAIYIDFNGYTVDDPATTDVNEGDIDGQTGWTDGNGFSAASGATWTVPAGSAVVVDGDLGTDAVKNPPPGSQPTANPYVTVTASGGEAYAQLDVTGVSGDGYWLAAVVDFPLTPPSTSGWNGVEARRGGDLLVYLGRAWGRSNYSCGTAGGEFYTTVPIWDESDESTPTLLVYHYDGTTADMWVNPDLTEPAPAPDGSDPDGDAGDQSGIDKIRIRLGNDGTQHVDSVYLGTDSPFVPEPATMSLLAVGGLGVLIRRRRRA